MFKSFLKLIALITGVILVLGIIGLILIIRAMPSPNEIGRYLQPSTAREALATKPTAPVPSNPSAESPPPSPAPRTGVPEQEPPGPSTTSRDREEDQKLLADLMDERLPLANVCAYLKNTSPGRFKPYNLTDFGQKFKDSVLSEEKDPIIQAMKVPLRFVMTQPRMKELLHAAQAAAERGEEPSFLKKSGFYAQAYAAYRELNQKKPVLEELTDRSYFLMMMAKASGQKPELVSDTYVLQYCESIERAINQGTPVSLAEERKEFEKFLRSQNVDTQEIGYDPTYRTNLTMSLSASGLQFHGGWVDSMLQPQREEIRAIEERARR